MRRYAAVVALMVVLAAVLPASAGAATISPNILTDDYDASADGTCSLREAVQSANQNSNFGSCVATNLPYGTMSNQPDTVALGDGPFTLTTPASTSTNEHGNLDVQSGGNITISHAGSGAAVIDGGDQDNVFNNVGTLNISGVTIQNGRRMGFGGGIVSVGSLILTNVTLTDNETAIEGGGGAISSSAGGMTLTNVTISGNRAQNGGGGIYTTGVSGASLINVTVSDNTADSDADGSAGGGGGIWKDGTVAPILKNTIIDGNSDNNPATQAPDCSGTLMTLDHNLIGDATTPCVFTPAAGDQVGVSAGLVALDDNGGPTPTHALPLASLALDEVPPGDCASLTADQRGYPRPFPGGGNCDVGAYELVSCGGVPLNDPGAFPGCPPPPPPPPPPSPLTTPIATPVAAAAAAKKCRKGFKRKKGKCVRRQRK